jgi:hypothetical protein
LNGSTTAAPRDGEQLAEGPVEVRAVELVDDEPPPGLDGLDEEAGSEDEPSAVGWRPPIVSKVVHSLVAVVGR